MGWANIEMSIGFSKLITGDNQAEVKYLGKEKIKKDLASLSPNLR